MRYGLKALTDNNPGPKTSAGTRCAQTCVMALLALACMPALAIPVRTAFTGIANWYWTHGDELTVEGWYQYDPDEAISYGENGSGWIFGDYGAYASFEGGNTRFFAAFSDGSKLVSSSFSISYLNDPGTGTGPVTCNFPSPCDFFMFSGGGITFDFTDPTGAIFGPQVTSLAGTNIPVTMGSPLFQFDSVLAGFELRSLTPLQPLPEPSTLVLFSLGLLGLGLSRRKLN